MRTLSIRIPDAIAAEIAAEAKARNVTKSIIARERLARETAATNRPKQSLWDRMEDLVLTSSDLPKDLSSTKAYLKNYGSVTAEQSKFEN